MGELLVRSENGIEIYLAAEVPQEVGRKFIAVVVVVREFDPRFERGPLFRPLPGLPYAEIPFYRFLDGRTVDLAVCRAPWFSARRPIGMPSRIFRSLPHGAVGPKTRRQFWMIDEGTVLSHETEIPLSTDFKVYGVSLKLPSPSRNENFPANTKRVLLKAADYKCQMCGSAETLEVDHVKPVYRGGKGVFDNGQVLCRNCHIEKTKADRPPHSW